MTGSKDPIPFAAQTWWIELQFHQFVHILQHHHITIELYNPIIFDQRERCEFAPAVIEASIIAVILVYRWEEVFDLLLCDSATVQGLMAFLRKGIRVESDERIFGLMFLQRVGES